MDVTLSAEGFDSRWSTLDNGLTSRGLAVQKPKRILLQPFLALFADLLLMLAVIIHQSIQVARTAFGTTDTVYLKAEILESQFVEEMPSHRHDLQIERRILLSQRLHVELGMLPVPPCLGTFVPEYRPQRPDLHRFGQTRHPVLKV